MSGDTLLREARLAKCPLPERSRVIGVDDWALRRGQNYATLVVDLERHQPVSLLPDRRWETFRDWLLQHPGVEVVSRDRADCYARGAAAGAPEAQQVADRWHLLRNLREALKRTAEQFMGDIRQATREVAMMRSKPGSVPPPTVEATPSVTTSPEQDSGRSLREIRRSRRLERYQRVQQLRGEGKSQRAIARILGLNRETVRRFCHAPEFPERAVRLREGHATPFWAELSQLWNSGCHNARILTKKITALGYRGSYDSVRRLVAHWRQEAKLRTRTQQGQAAKTPMLSAKRVAWLMFLSPDDLEGNDRNLATAIQERCPDLQVAAELAHDFVRLVNDRNVDRLSPWIDRASAKNSPIALRQFARGLQSELPTIAAALMLPWSNGQTEGQVNRLKLIKRQMYGRAKLDLLAQRFLWRPENN
jgi:transposase